MQVRPTPTGAKKSSRAKKIEGTGKYLATQMHPVMTLAISQSVLTGRTQFLQSVNS